QTHRIQHKKLRLKQLNNLRCITEKLYFQERSSQVKMLKIL
ncbi:polymorphic outer membrane protein, partial [Chlamydia psittaci 08DC60]